MRPFVTLTRGSIQVSPRAPVRIMHPIQETP